MRLILLAAGCLFPLISWLTLAMSVINAHRGRSSSGAYMPFIGPVLISIWLVQAGAPPWTLVLAWIGDIGTVFFMLALPSLARDI